MLRRPRITRSAISLGIRKLLTTPQLECGVMSRDYSGALPLPCALGTISVRP
ncbi:hypothetical protein BDV10DRAFT_161872 [Aspergillus recurvatus]